MNSSHTIFPALRKLFPIIFLALALAGGPAHAESIKDDAKKTGHAVGEAVHEVGHEAKKVGKEVEEGAKKVGHTVSSTAKEGVEAVKEGGKEMKRAVKGEK